MSGVNSVSGVSRLCRLAAPGMMKMELGFGSQGFEGVFKLLPSQDFAGSSSVGVPLATSRLRRGGIEH